nr:AAA family ATPase [Candidatus Endomicrobium trichonymphae]
MKIENYKCFREFSLELNKDMNIIVGYNESGKSTILEAIHLVLSGYLPNGKYLSNNELSEYIFNKEIEKEYLDSLNGIDNHQNPPRVLIEIFFDSNDLPEFEGDGNSDKEKNCGLCLKIEFNDEYQRDYNELIKTKITSIPIEYYKIVRMSFARDNITKKKIPIKSVLINSNSISARSSNIYISKIKDDLTVRESVTLLQTYRKRRTMFNQY